MANSKLYLERHNFWRDNIINGRCLVRTCGMLDVVCPGTHLASVTVLWELRMGFVLLMNKLILREVKPHRKWRDVTKAVGNTWRGFHEGFSGPKSPHSQLLFQSIFLRTSGTNISFCSMAAHARKLVFLPLKFQRGNPWISCDGSLQCQREILTSVRVFSLLLWCVLSETWWP